MRAIARRLTLLLDREDINWERESVAFEFLAIGCLINAASSQGWKTRAFSPPASLRIDAWNRFPTYSFGRFGSRFRRSSIEHLYWVLMPRFCLESPFNRTLSIFYQGFPPKDVSGERPDWLIIEGKITVTSHADAVRIRFEDNGLKWEGTYETLLGPYGPSKRTETGVLPTPEGIIEVSLLKHSDHLTNQINRYKKVYGAIKYAGFLGCDVNSSSFPIVKVSRSSNNERLFEDCVLAGKQLFQLFTS